MVEVTIKAPTLRVEVWSLSIAKAPTPCRESVAGHTEGLLLASGVACSTPAELLLLVVGC